MVGARLQRSLPSIPPLLFPETCIDHRVALRTARAERNPAEIISNTSHAYLSSRYFATTRKRRTDDRIDIAVMCDRLRLSDPAPVAGACKIPV
jgi:hypothetical protein